MADQHPPLPAEIQFIAYHRPGLRDGKYFIEAVPSLQTEGTERLGSGTQVKAFQVSGTRFGLQPRELFSVFPPSGSLGDHANVLPHIVLNRSTIPWERYADGSSEDVPWLALLVFDSSDGAKVEPQTISLKALKDSAPTKHYPDFELEVGEMETDTVTVIDIPKTLMQKVLPSKDDIKHLAHVRQGFDVHGNISGGEYAVVIANRLPVSGGLNHVHLVALENRYNAQGFDYLGASDGDTIRLVSLHHWQFANVDKNKSLPRILEHLNTVGNNNPSDHNLRLPDTGQAGADTFLFQGYVPLKHYMRNGNKGVSWYHGPLATGYNPNHADALPVLGADALLRYDQKNGFFDVSYAAAWELGRMLLLQSQLISVSLYNWKRTHAQRIKAAELQLAHDHLPKQSLFRPGDSPEDIPEQVRTWFQDLSLLKGVPFNYLVPDADMLPVESLRFFVIDNEWVECLLDGAFSVGRVSSGDHQQDQAHHQTNRHPQSPFDHLSGLLMRSSAVTGWPDLHLTAYQSQSSISLSQKSITVLKNPNSTSAKISAALKADFKGAELAATTEIIGEQWLVHDLDNDEQYAIRKQGNAFEVWLKNKLLRREQLSSNVLLCIFEGLIEEVDIFQKPETLHFGVDGGDSPAVYSKTLKNRQGDEVQSEKIAPLPYRNNNPEARVLDIDGLADQIKSKLSFSTMDAALFAIEMTEGVERIRYKKG